MWNDNKSKIKPEEIVQLSSEWRSLYSQNDDLGNLITSFVAGKQWSPSVEASRKMAGKEVLTINIMINHRDRVLADYLSVDYTLAVEPKLSKNYQEIKRAESQLRSIILDTEKRDVFYNSYGRYITYGYDVMRVNASYESNISQQLVPKVEILNPKNCFFDPKAITPIKADGRYCGVVHAMEAQALAKMYPKYKPKEQYFSRWDDSKDNFIFSDGHKETVYEFYFKKKVPVKFYKVSGNKFKPEDELNNYEKSIGGKEYFERMISKVFICICTNDTVLLEPQEYYVNQLPLVFVGEPFHTTYNGEYSEIIVPYLSRMKDPQQMLNNSASQISTQVTKKIDRSVVMPKQGISEVDNNHWQNFNTHSGTFLWNAEETNGAQPQVIDPPRVELELLQTMMGFKSMIDESGGVSLSKQGSSEDGMQSGIALAQRISQGDLVQKRLLYTFIKAINQIGSLIKEMAAKIITEEYPLKIGDSFEIMNKPAPSSTEQEKVYINSLKSLHEEYNFVIKATPSSALEKQRSRETYLQITRLMPQLAPYVMDLLVENLDVNNSLELTNRVKMLVDPALDAAGKGEISRQQYMQIQNQRNMQAQQSNPDPLMASVQMEAQNNEQRNMLKAQEMQNKFILEKQKLAMQRAKIMADTDYKRKEAAIKLLATAEKNLDRRITI